MNSRTGWHKAIVGLLALVATAAAQADVNFQIVNVDAAGEGFNDPSAPLLPAPGNDTAATLGEQRLIAFQFAADLWGARLDNNGGGDITVVINATFAPADCDAMGGNLGSAGATNIFRNFPGAPQVDTFYVSALADALAGNDLNPGAADISANFNGDIDRNPNCLGDGGANSTNWYYGLDTRPPGGTIDFLDTAVHEIGHGIGFVSTVNETTGTLIAGTPDSYVLNLFDVDQQLAWPDMTNAQRLASVTNTGGVVWTGPQASGPGIAEFLGGIRDGLPRMFAPNPRQAGSSISHWDTAISPNTFMEPFATGDNRVIETFGAELCAMADIGWPLQPGTQCPDPIIRATATVGSGSPASCSEAALIAAVASGDGRLIDFDCGAAPHSIVLSSPVFFTGGFNELDGGGLITLDGNSSTLVIANNAASSRLTLRGMSLVNGNGGNGGGVFNLGTLNVVDSTLANNFAAGVGGGVINASTGAAVNAIGSLFSGNSADDNGGGIFNFGATVNAINSTFESNQSATNGAAIFTEGLAGTASSVNLRSTTLAGNDSVGGSLTDTGGNIEVINSILVDNAVGDVCVGVGSFLARGENLDNDSSCALLAGSGFTTVGAPGLGPLADNGGPTQTLALLEGSPALDAGDDARCAFYPVSDVDQRGEPRDATLCDIGAFEFIAGVATDTDMDGLPDDYENANGLDPNDDGSGDINNGPDGDLDMDGVLNIDEFNAGTAANNPDSEGDGIGDGFDLDPANASNACVVDNTGPPGAMQFNTVAMAAATTQCASKSQITIRAGATLETPNAELELFAPTVIFDPNVAVPAGPQLEVNAVDPTPGAAP